MRYVFAVEQQELFDDVPSPTRGIFSTEAKAVAWLRENGFIEAEPELWMEGSDEMVENTGMWKLKGYGMRVAIFRYTLDEAVSGWQRGRQAGMVQ